MGLFHRNSQTSLHILQFVIINLVGWILNIALAQEDVFASAFGSVDFPITSLINLSVFAVTLIRGRLDLENDAREVMATLRAPKLYEINGINGKVLTTIEQIHGSTEGGRRDLHTASVVMLSNGTPNASMKQFMKFSAADDVHSILLQYQPLNDAMNDVKGAIGECSRECKCNCIVLGTSKEIIDMLDGRMPGALKGPAGN